MPRLLPCGATALLVALARGRSLVARTQSSFSDQFTAASQSLGIDSRLAAGLMGEVRLRMASGAASGSAADVGDDLSLLIDGEDEVPDAKPAAIPLPAIPLPGGDVRAGPAVPDAAPPVDGDGAVAGPNLFTTATARR